MVRDGYPWGMAGMENATIQLTFTYSKLTIKTLEKEVKYVQS